MAGEGNDVVFEQLQIQRIRDEILPLFARLAAGDEAFFENPYLGRSRDPLRPESVMCAVGGELHERCWQHVRESRRRLHPETLCFPVDCRECPVYVDARPTIVEELGEEFNNMVHLLRRNRKHVQSAMNFTRDLASSLEDLDLENHRIREEMNLDPLTGLFNRRFLDESLEHEVQRCQHRRRQLSLLMLDIDHFKTWNDLHGHLEGDRMLARFGKLLRASIRDYDRAFRFGGEEFLVLFPDTGLEDARNVAERIRRRFEQLVFNVPVSRDFPEGRDSRTISGGVACYREGLGAMELLEMADQALYCAKSSGRNRIEYLPLHVVA